VHLQQAFEAIDRLLGLPREDVYPDELMQQVRPGHQVLFHGTKLEGAPAFADRVVGVPEIAERQPE